MNPITIGGLATAFRITGWAAGLPSLAMLLFYAWHMARQQAATPTPPSTFPENSDGLMLILKGTVKVLETAGTVATALEQMVYNILAGAAMAGLVTAIVCAAVGHGLRAEAGWARWCAFAVLLLLLAVTLLGTLSLSDAGRAVMLAAALLSGFLLHALWVGYGGPR